MKSSGEELRDSAYLLPPGSRWLVVNADDFGLHPDINRAVVSAHRDGIVTSASLVACGLAFDEAVALARGCPALDIGVHLTLIEEQPLSPAAAVPSLVNRAGRFWRDHRLFSWRLLTGRIRLAEIERELTGQIQRVLAAGLRPSHLDSHQHVHLLPGLWLLVTGLARRYAIPWVRVPRFPTLTRHTSARVEPLFRLGLNTLSQVRRRQLEELRSARHSPGLDLSGRLTGERLLALLPGLPVGVAELVTHPGITTKALQGRYRWGYDWTEEYEALIDPEILRAIQDDGIRLTTFAALAQRGRAPGATAEPERR